MILPRKVGRKEKDFVLYCVKNHGKGGNVMTPARKLYLDNIRWMTVVLVVIYHVVYPQQGIHLLRRILIAAVLVMYQNVVHFLDLPGGLLAEAAYRSSQCKDPNGGTDRHMVILRQVDAQGSNRHRPAVHPIASAPPEAQCSFCALRGTNLIESGTCPIRFFHRLLFYIAHPGKIDHQPFGVRSDMGIIAFA